MMNTFLIALDGASPPLLNKWMDEGHLENLRKIRRQGLSGKLRSTFPPLTGPAWSSFHTGVNPGKHGVFGWLDVTSSYRGQVINGSSIKTRTVWNELSRQERKVGLVSVPVTYPPEPINGFVVPGFLTPADASQRSHPEGLAQDLLNKFPDYEYCSEPFVRTKEPSNWIKNLKKAALNRGRAARYLYKNHFSDASNATMAVHFFATDFVQHYLWDHVTEDWDPRLEVFKEVDRQIGKIMDMAPDDSKFIVLSDHGFGPVEKTFNVNTWLEKRGYLELNKGIRTKTRKGLANLGFTEQNTRSIGELFYEKARDWGLVGNPVVGVLTNKYIRPLFLSHEDVNWTQTCAYSRSDIGHIRMNLLDREKFGRIREKDYQEIRKEIMKRLAAVRVPGSGEKLAQWIKPKEEMYTGPYLKQAPDILFNSLEGSNCHGSIISYGGLMFFNSSLFSKKIHPGHHRRNGILMAYGKGVKEGKRNASMMDLAPTVLNLNNCRIPRQMDGKVISEISSDSPSYYTPDDFYREETVTKETPGTREKMKSLGYL